MESKEKEQVNYGDNNDESVHVGERETDEGQEDERETGCLASFHLRVIEASLILSFFLFLLLEDASRISFLKRESPV